MYAADEYCDTLELDNSNWENVKEDGMGHLKDLEFVRYYAFTRDPFDPDAEGYVEASALKDYDKNPWYIRWEGDVPIARKGYKLVQTEDGNWYAVRVSDIYTEVFPNSVLSGGYGMRYPAGGLTSASSYDTEAEFEGETILLQQRCW